MLCVCLLMYIFALGREYYYGNTPVPKPGPRFNLTIAGITRLEGAKKTYQVWGWPWPTAN